MKHQNFRDSLIEFLRSYRDHNPDAYVNPHVLCHFYNMFDDTGTEIPEDLAKWIDDMWER